MSTRLQIKHPYTDCTGVLLVNVVIQPAQHHILRNLISMSTMLDIHVTVCCSVYMCEQHILCRPYSDQAAAMVKLRAMGASNTAEAEAVAA